MLQSRQVFWRQGGFRAAGSGMPGPEVDTNPQQSNYEIPGLGGVQPKVFQRLPKMKLEGG